MMVMKVICRTDLDEYAPETISTLDPEHSSMSEEQYVSHTSLLQDLTSPDNQTQTENETGNGHDLNLPQTNSGTETGHDFNLPRPDYGFQQSVHPSESELQMFEQADVPSNKPR